MVRAMKVMAAGLPGGVSFMEDYTYHFAPTGDLILGRAHARGLPVDRRGRAAARGPPAVDRRQGRPGPARVRRPSGPGDRRLRDRHGQPLPDGRQRRSTSCRPSSRCRSCRSRARCGGPGPTCGRTRRPGSTPAARTTPASGYAVTAEHLADFAAMCGIELLVIDETTDLDAFRDRIRWNDLYHHLAGGL